MPALLLLEDFAKTPKLILGSRGHELGTLFAKGVSVLPTICIPTSTLEDIAHANGLTDKLHKLVTATRFGDPVSQTGFVKQVSKYFRELHIPSEISKQLLRAYATYLRESVVCIKPSEPIALENPEQFGHILGEANLAESILALWHALVLRRLRVVAAAQFTSQALYPSALLVHIQPLTISSGEIYSHHPFSGDKTSYYLESRWGVGGETKDTVLIDSRTLQVTATHVGLQTSHQARTAHSVSAQPVPASIQSRLSIPEAGIVALARDTQVIKRLHLDHVRIQWEFDGQRVFVTGVAPFEPGSLPARTTSADRQSRSKTATKLYVSAGNPYKAAEQVTELIDGIGVLRSEFTFAEFGSHPLHVLKSKAKNRLMDQLVNTITTYQTALHGRPLVYRALNLTSAELSHLSFATNYEPVEANPFLGQRGALKTRINPTIFEVELRALHTALEKSSAPLALLLPFVRTPTELSLLLDLVRKYDLLRHHQFSIWLQLNTPENILNLTAYPLQQIAGVSINVRTVAALLYGIDPDDPAVRGFYEFDEAILTPLISKVIKTLQQPLFMVSAHDQKQTVLHLEDYHPRLLEKAVELGISGVTVKPQVASIAKACIMDTESLLVRSTPHRK